MLNNRPQPPPQAEGLIGFSPLYPLFSTAGGELYSGTSYNFLGSEPIISRNSSHSPLRTEYAIPWLNGKKCVLLVSRVRHFIFPLPVPTPWGAGWVGLGTVAHVGS